MADYADRVKDTTTTTGTGDITLSGSAPTGFQTFAQAFSVSDRVYYAISSATSAEWEVGYGTLTGGTTLERTTVLESSNADAAVNFSAGTKDVFCTVPGASLRGFTTGPASSVDNTVPRFDSTSGKIYQTSLMSIDDSGAVTGITSLVVSANGAGLPVYPQVGLSVYSSNTVGYGQYINTRTYGTSASQTAVADNTGVGSFNYRVHNGTQVEEAASIYVQVDGTNVTGSGDHPSALIRFRNRGAAQTGQYDQTNRLIIDGDGGVIIGAATGGSQGAETLNTPALFLNGDRLSNATDAQLEAGTANTVFVTPSNQHRHPSSTKFWVKATGNSTTIVVSYNMTSWADTNTGDADGTIATDFSSADWSVCLAMQAGNTRWDATNTSGCGMDAQAAGTFGIVASQMSDGGTAVAARFDPTAWHCSGLGDL